MEAVQGWRQWEIDLIKCGSAALVLRPPGEGELLNSFIQDYVGWKLHDPLVIERRKEYVEILCDERIYVVPIKLLKPVGEEYTEVLLRILEMQASDE